MINRFFTPPSSNENSQGKDFSDFVKKTHAEKISTCISKIQNKLINIDDVIDGSGLSLIHYVAAFGDVKSLEWLIDNGANIDLKIGSDERLESMSALHFAVQKNNIEVLKFLLEKTNTPINVSTSDGTTPLLIAAHDQNEPLINLLIQHGENVNCTFKKYGKSYTLLETLFIEGGPLKSIEILLHLDATITHEAMQSAVRSSHLEGIKLLLQYGAIFTQDLLELATDYKNEKFERVEKSKMELDRQRDKMSEDEFIVASMDVDFDIRRLNERKEIEVLIESALSSANKLRPF